MFYVLSLIDLLFFGSCLIACMFFGARCNQLVFQHRFFLSHLNLRLEEATQASARAMFAAMKFEASGAAVSLGFRKLEARARPPPAPSAADESRAAAARVSAEACPLCRESILHCPCLRFIALCERHIQRDHRLHPETMIGMRADVNLLRV
eukprot:tig00000334_g24111.t1